MILPVLEELGVDVVSVGAEIKGRCPVHHLATGREDRKPSWYMNATTGAWLCFSCNQKGSLPYLVELLGADPSIVAWAPVEAAKRRLHEMSAPTDPVTEDRPEVDEGWFWSLPLPPNRLCERRDFDQETADIMGLRWSPGGKCWMIPVISFDGQLLGWQEKSSGYFNNVPRDMKKSQSLFGYHHALGDRVAVVESPLDVVRMRAYGIYAVATYGAFVSDEQAAALVRRFNSLVLAFDRDDAGHAASVHLPRQLSKLDASPRIFYFNYIGPDGKDPGELPPSALVDGYVSARLIAPPEVLHADKKASKRAKPLPGGRSQSHQRRQERSIW